ncbi:hypothetical protein DRI50_04020 [candidate division KSB1 bacterium]|nr:MAG: hypothetical protein DRI50_04020 [candidate division KSB1 bacterium]
MKHKSSFKIQRTFAQYLSVFALAALILILSCNNFDEPSVKKSHTKPKPAGNIYFKFSGIDSIYFLDTERHQFKTVNIAVPQLWDFDISQDGNWLLVAYGSYIDRYNLLKFHRDYSRKVEFLPRGRITCNGDGRVIIYETEYHAQRRLAVLYIETGDNFILSSANDGAAFAPKIAHSGNEYAWTQYDGLYYGRINQIIVQRLSPKSIEAEDFSPSGVYLAADGDIFDVRSFSKYPGEHGGHLRFIDDYFLIQQKPSDSDSLQKINISGTERTYLFHTGMPIINFAVSNSQRFVIAVCTSPDAERFLFYVFDFVDLEDEFNLSFPVVRQAALSKLIWPVPPSSSSQHD